MLNYCLTLKMFEVSWVFIYSWDVCVSELCCCLQDMRYWVELKLLGSSRLLGGVRQVGNYKKLRLRWNVVFILMMTMTYHMIFIAIIAYQILSTHCWIFSQKIYGNNSGKFEFLWSALQVAILENNYGLLLYCFFIWDCYR